MQKFAYLALALVLLTSCKAPAPPKPAAPKPAPAPAPADAAALEARFAKTDIRITQEEFEQLRPGMTHDQVVTIVGSDETETRTHYNAGSAEEFTRPSMSIIYRWDNPDGSWCELEFLDKKLETKRHQDLKPAASYKNTAYTIPESRAALRQPLGHPK